MLAIWIVVLSKEDLFSLLCHGPSGEILVSHTEYLGDDIISLFLVS